MDNPFQVYGPYEVNRERVSDRNWQNGEWDYIDDLVGADLSSAKGAYVFSLRHGEKYTPLYVGITNKGFRHEVFGVHNREKVHYNWRKEKGQIVFHLLAKPKSVRRGFSKNIRRDWLQALEALLIFMCRRSNKKLLNKKHMKWLDAVGILGVTHTEVHRGKPPREIQTFKRVLRW
ncbi:hypothetical protein JQ621_31920 [Bradyrhizobium manausense]|uniref:hypothetical protein n=1 Tax=Bradyrhizobium manausense TaxID=989370 RepID=UPI001BAA865E|nr:hypothetical protein [Bradyrhizobium manausense]MBR1092080.1 hypothetical protein [Bradyrhizobium manausense]